MNKERKQRFYDVIASLEDALSELNDIRDEEQDAFDALSEGLQCSSRGEKMEEYLSLIDAANDKIEDISSFIEEEIIKKK